MSQLFYVYNVFKQTLIVYCQGAEDKDETQCLPNFYQICLKIISPLHTIRNLIDTPVKGPDMVKGLSLAFNTSQGW